MKTPIRRTFARALAGALGVVFVGLAATACGSSSSKSSASTTTSTTTSTTRTATAGASPTTASSPTVTTGPVHATLHGQDHKPRVGKRWLYSVHVTDAGGRPLSGTVETDFVVSGLGVVGKETPAVHRLKNGVLKDNINYPAEAEGHPITLVTVVRTSAGSVALAWPVTATK